MTEQDEKKKHVYVVLTKKIGNLNTNFYEERTLNGILYFGYTFNKQDAKNYIDSFRSKKDIYYVRLHAGYIQELADKHSFYMSEIYGCGKIMLTEDESEFIYNAMDDCWGNDELTNLLVQVHDLLKRYKHKKLKKYRKETMEIIKILTGHCDPDLYDDIQESISEKVITKDLLKLYDLR